jgi:LacI family transcriptional regulator, galactose operon repressor
MKRVTIEDVARAAGVSRQTVSRAINQKDEISPVTMTRVMETVDRLGYHPSWVARGLATQRTQVVGLVVPDITNPFFPEIARGVQDAARARNYNVFLCNTDESADQELQVLYSLAAQPVDGILLFGSRISDADLAAFADQYQPLVVLNRWLERADVSMILVDNHLGARLAVEHLAERGHRNMGMLAGPLASPSSLQRVQGFRQAMAERALPVPDSCIVTGAPTLDGGHEAARQLLMRHPEVTGLLAYNDLVALGALQACKQLGRPVPGGCAVVGFDDIRLASMVSPALTTIRVDKYDLGCQAMQRLLQILDDPAGCAPPVHVPVELVVRQST